MLPRDDAYIHDEDGGPRTVAYSQSMSKSSKDVHCADEGASVKI